MRKTYATLVHAFILAGGFATRLWPLTEKRAKPLLPLAGKPIVSHLVEKIPAGIPITVSTNAIFGEQFNAWASGLPAGKAGVGRGNLSVIIEDTTHDDHKLGALGALAQWIRTQKIDEDVLVLTGDNYLGFRMEDFFAAYTEGVPLLAAHDIGDHEKAKHFGVVEADGNRIVQFFEKPSSPASTLVSTGCSILPARILPILVNFAKEHPDNVGGIFEELLRQKIPVECFTFSESWLDIGSFGSYLEAHRLVVGARSIVDPGATVAHTTCHGSVCIGAGAEISESDLTDCIIFGSSRIHNCVLRECIIDIDCTLEGIDLTHKMLRTGTVLRTSGKLKAESGK